MVLWAAGLCSACIIPDSGIRLQEVFENPGRVRIIQPTPVTDDADEACDDASELLLRCPLPPDNTIPQGLIDDPQLPFCVCPAGNRDDNALQPFEIYVEDPDLDEQGAPRDTIFGVFLLDPEPDAADDPSGSIAYENYLRPTTPAEVLQSISIGPYRDSIERATPRVRSWWIGLDTGPVDLCNRNGENRLAPGLHELRLVVTDRPWYVPVELDAKGEVQRDDEGNVLRKDAPPHVGVPDLPGGATYDVATYVFRCGNGTTSEPDPACRCVQEES